jgi:hypothetical protein
MGDLPRWKMMVLLWWVTYPDGRWSHCDGWPTQMEDNGLIMMGDLPRWKMKGGLIVMGDLPKKMQNFFQKNGLIVMGDLPRCKMIKMWIGLIVMGDLPKWKRVVSLWWVTYPDGMIKIGIGLIVMGDLPKWKMVSLWWVTYPNEDDGLIMMGDLPRKDDGLIMMGDLPRWNVGLIVMGDLPKKRMLVSLWWVTYPDGKKSGLIMMGDLPRWKMVSLWWVTYPKKDVGEGSKAHSKGGRVRKRTTWEVRAQRRTQKEVGLANALPKRWWLKGALGRR